MKIVVFSDLDETLLDKETYSWAPAQEAVEALRKREAALVLVTSKTLGEVALFHRELGFDDPLVFENGGGIAVRGYDLPGGAVLPPHVRRSVIEKQGFRVFPLGMEYESLVRSLAEISSETAIPLKGFSAMSAEEVAALTGLPVEQAVAARARLFDEPFVILGGPKSDETEIMNAAGRRGLTVAKGGRFLHLIGHSGKGTAVSMLLEGFRKRYGGVLSVGLGDSPNDFPFLELVDRPVILGKPSKGEPPLRCADKACRMPLRGPEGWNRAVLDILASL